MTWAPRYRRHRHIAAALLVVALVGAALALARYCRSLGYPDGPIYTVVPARAAPAPALRGTVAIFLSGDMGFNTGMGPRIAARLAQRGVGVIGVNSLTAFSYRRTPAQATELVETAMQRALQLPGARRVVLIGQSFGADALIVGLTGLRPSYRSLVPIVELVVPGDTMLLRATPASVLSPSPDGPALPLARKIDWVPVVCLHGQTEADSLCPLWRQANVRRIALPGDHFLHKDTALIAATLLRAMASPELPKVQAPPNSRQSGRS